MFDFEKELAALNKTQEDFENFLEDDAENFAEYSDIEIQKVFILQERTIASANELGIEVRSHLLADAMTNLILNY